MHSILNVFQEMLLMQSFDLKNILKIKAVKNKQAESKNAL